MEINLIDIIIVSILVLLFTNTILNTIILYKTTKREGEWKRRREEFKNKRNNTSNNIQPKREFSKKLTAWLVIFGIFCIISNYALAFLDKNINEGVTIAVITQIVATNVSYLLYQFSLKNSRNKYSIDEEGHRCKYS